MRLVAAALISLVPLVRGAPVWVEREAFLMGTTLRANVAASDRPAATDAISSAFAAARRVDDLLSSWRGDSELARLNAAQPGRPVALSPALLALLLEARRWSEATGHAFDPTVGALVDAWDLRGAGRIPQPARLAAARAATGDSLVALDSAASTARRLAAGAWLDSGGFGKGVALRDAADSLAGRGVTDALLDFGGQVLALGRGLDGRGWPVPVAHPADRRRPVALLRLTDRSAATSSQSERFVEAAGRRLGHLLDPRTGEPVPAWGSVTVVAADPAVADILSTALFVLGPDAGLAWARERADIGALFLVNDRGRLRARWNRAMEPYLESTTISTQGG